MRILILYFLGNIFFLNAYSQTYALKITDTRLQKEKIAKQGDKILIGFKTPRNNLRGKFENIYKLSDADKKDSVFVFSKGRIVGFTDSTVILKEKNSLFSSTTREIYLSKISAAKRLSGGEQILRTLSQTGGYTAFFVMIFYSYAAVGGGEGFVVGMFEASCIGPVLTRFGRTHISKKKRNNCRVSLTII